MHSVIHGLRKAYMDHYSEGDSTKEKEIKAELRQSVNDAYYTRVLPVLAKYDPDGKKLEWLRKGLEDSSSRVRLAAIRGMLFYPSDGNVKLLVRHLQDSEKKKKKIYDEWLMTIFVLEKLTRKSYGEFVADWVQWEKVRNAPVEERLGEATEGEKGKETVVLEEDGVKMNVTFTVAGEGYPLMVLPWQDCEPEFMRPYFRGIEEFCEVYYMRMPRIDECEGLKNWANSGIPMYPTEQLAKALNKLMKDSGLEQFGIFAHGPGACTMGMMVTAANPDMVSHLVLLNPMSAGNKYRQMMNNVQGVGRSKDCWEIVNGIDYWTVDPSGKRTYEPVSKDEEKGLERALYNLRFADATSPEISLLHAMFRDEETPDVMNDPDWSIHKIIGKRKLRIPVMVMMGTRSPWTMEKDMKSVASTVGRSSVVKLPGSGEFPFIFQSYKFTQSFSKLFKKAKLKKRKKTKKDSG